MKNLKSHLFRLMAVHAFVLTECNAQSSHGSLLALSKTDHTLAIVDPVSLNVITRIPVGSDPHEVIASSDERRLMLPSMEAGAYTN